MGKPSLPTIKRLFAVSGNRCAFPDCTLPVIDRATGKPIGKVCHIKGNKSTSARHDAGQPEAERQSFANLLLLCGPHHDVIDAAPNLNTYTVAALAEMKRVHEAKFESGPPGQLSDDEAERFLIQISDNAVTNGSVMGVHLNEGIVAHHVEINTFVEPGEREDDNREPGLVVPHAGDWPDFGVLAYSSDGRGPFRAAKYWKAFVQSPALAEPSMEPEVEDGFLEGVKKEFWRDGDTVRDGDESGSLRVILRRTGPNCAFDRRWGRWLRGVVGMSATLPTPENPTTYSFGDLAIDLTRFLRLVASIRWDAKSRVRVEVYPHDLEARLETARYLPGAGKLGGVLQIEWPKPKWQTDPGVETLRDLEDEWRDPATAAAALLADIWRERHRARVSKAKLAESIRALVASDDAMRP